jgi:hypothetical protein
VRGNSGEGLESGRSLLILHEMWGKGCNESSTLKKKKKGWCNFPSCKKILAVLRALGETDASNPAQSGLLS